MSLDPEELRRTAAEAREQQVQREAVQRADLKTKLDAKVKQAFAEETRRFVQADLPAQVRQEVTWAAARGSLSTSFEVAKYETERYETMDEILSYAYPGRDIGHGQRIDSSYSSRLAENLGKIAAAVEMAEQVARDLSRTPGVHAQAVQRRTTEYLEAPRFFPHGSGLGHNADFIRVSVRVDIDPK